MSEINIDSQLGKLRLAFSNRNLHPVALIPQKFCDTVKSMENKSTSSQLPTALRLGMGLRAAVRFVANLTSLPANFRVFTF